MPLGCLKLMRRLLLSLAERNPYPVSNANAHGRRTARGILVNGPSPPCSESALSYSGLTACGKISLELRTMVSAANPLAESFFCDRCGEEFEPKHRKCEACGAVPTRQWFQLMSLVTLFATVSCNSAVGILVLPRLVAAHRAGRLFQLWLWFDHKIVLYGWLPILFGLMTWDYFIWRRAKLKGVRPKIKRWLTRKVLTLVVATAITPMIPWWIPAGQVPYQFLSLIGRYSGLPPALAWAAVAFVLALLCGHRQTRDSLLGHGKVLSVISLSALLAVLAVTLAGWSLSY